MLLLEKLEQKRKYIVIIMLICLLVGVLYSLFFIPIRSTSEATLMLIEKTEKSETDFISNGNLELTKKIVSNFEEIIKSDSSINLLNSEIKTDLSVNELKNTIQVKKNSNSDTFKIIVENSDSELALKINKNLIESFSENLKTIYTNTEVYIVDNAHIEESINYEAIAKTIFISIVISIIINIIYVISLIEIDKKIKKSNDIESEFSLKSLGKIPVNKSKTKLIENTVKNSYSNAFRDLRSNIQFINVNNKEKNTILVTSSRKGEGKTLVAANIGIAFAKTGQKVIIIDADMISGKIAQTFSIPNDLGLSNYLSGIDENGSQVNERINKFIKDTTVKNLNIITSGTIPPNSSELLSMPKFEEMVKDLSVFYDVVIFDTTAVLNATDALILTRLANSTIIVSGYKKTKKDDLWHTKRDIQNVGGRIIGIVINKIKVKEKREKIYIKAKQLIKDKYVKFKNYIITKRDNRKQKLLDAAIIEEKQKLTNELKEEENKLIEEIKKEELEEKYKDVKPIKSNIFTNISLNLNQIINKEEKDINKKITKENVIKPDINKDNKNEIVKEKIILHDNKPTDDIIEEKVNKVGTKINNEEKVNTEIYNEEKINTEIYNEEKDKNSLKQSISSKLVTVKDKIAVFGNKIKEKSSIAVSKVNEKIKEIRKQAKNRKDEEIKEEIAQEKIRESKEIIKENSEKLENEKIPLNTKKQNVKEDKDENTVLVIVDAENGYCRAFSQYCFTEKLIRGIDKTDGFVKANYSSSVLNRKKIELIAKYELSKKQVERIDTLIYTVLQEYDEHVWVERKTTSNKAEDYIICMSKEYEKSDTETKKNYELRCQYLRRVELAKAQIEIEYKTNNLWSSTQISFTDKLVLLKFAEKYEKLKERKKNEQREKNEQKEKIDNTIEKQLALKKVLNILKKIKVDKLKAKSTDELAKEKDSDFENYKIEDYENYNKLTEQDLEEQRIKIEQQEMLKEQIKLKKELKEKKTYEKNKKREEKNKKRAEQRKSKELERQKLKEEARIEEELLEDNLYPKTKYNKNL